MWIVAIAWMYVALMMSMAEATSPDGTVLGAVVTFVFYGVGPLALVMYLLGTPSRRRALRRREAEEQAQQRASVEAPAGLSSEPPAVPDARTTSQDPDGSGLTAGDSVAPERKEP